MGIDPVGLAENAEGLGELRTRAGLTIETRMPAAASRCAANS